MKRISRGLIFLTLGVVLLLTAAGWYAYNIAEDHRAGERSEEILQVLDTTPKPSGENVTVLGEAFCGVISVDKIALRLPVYAEWDYERLDTAPCRYAGSIETGDIIIAAHNYQSHFGALNKLLVEDLIRFTDAGGREHTYRVCEIVTLDGSAVTDMQAGGWDMTLFTCTKGGKQRITLRCQKIS